MSPDQDMPRALHRASPLVSDLPAETSDKSEHTESAIETVNLSPERNVQGFKWMCVVVSILCSMFLYALDTSLMANIRPSIIDDFGRVDLLPWLSVAYLFGTTSTIPIWAKLHSQFNNKTLYLASVAIFEIGSAVSGSAKSMDILIFGRVLTGLGGAGVYIGTMGILTKMTTLAERAVYLSYVGVAWSLGTILGPIVGGAFVDSAASWMWAFYLNLCVAVVTGPICIFLIPSIAPGSPKTLAARIIHFDFVGALLYLAAVLVLNMILALGGSIYPWDSHAMIILYVFAPITWFAFALQQQFGLFTVDKLFPWHSTTRWMTMSMFIWAAIATSNMSTTVYSLPLIFQFAFGQSTIRTGVLMLPYVLTLVLSAISGGRIFPKTPIYFAWYLSCGSLMLIGNALLSTISHTTTIGTICGYSVIQAFGLGATIQLGYTVAQTKASKTDLRQVTGFLSNATMLGSCLGIGISTCIFINLATSRTAAILPDVTRVDVENLLSGATSVTLIQDLDSATRQRVLDVVTRALGTVFYTNVAGSALGIIVAVLMNKEKLVLK